MIRLNLEEAIGFIIAAIGGAMALRVFYLEVRHYCRVLRSKKWPSVQGTVHKGEFLEEGSYVRLSSLRSMLGYTYVVNRVPYCGFFVTEAADSHSSSKLQEALDGSTVNVRYDPSKPGLSLLDSGEVCGRKISQDPLSLGRW